MVYRQREYVLTIGGGSASRLDSEQLQQLLFAVLNAELIRVEELEEFVEGADGIELTDQ